MGFLDTSANRGVLPPACQWEDFPMGAGTGAHYLAFPRMLDASGLRPGRRGLASVRCGAVRCGACHDDDGG